LFRISTAALLTLCITTRIVKIFGYGKIYYISKTGEKSFMNSMILVGFKNNEKEQMKKKNRRHISRLLFLLS
jgi:hypothetical protein